jgi:hypothetical protein
VPIRIVAFVVVATLVATSGCLIRLCSFVDSYQPLHRWQVLMLVALCAVSHWWSLLRPTPRPFLRRIATIAAFVTCLFGAASSQDPPSVGMLAMVASAVLMGCLLLELRLDEPPEPPLPIATAKARTTAGAPWSSSS